jgi:hypothetical protein
MSSIAKQLLECAACIYHTTEESLRPAPLGCTEPLNFRAEGIGVARMFFKRCILAASLAVGVSAGVFQLG